MIVGTYRELTERLEETTCRSSSVTIVVTEELEKRCRVSPWASDTIQRVVDFIYTDS